jgi:acetyl esterase
VRRPPDGAAGGTPVESLTPARVRREELAVLELQVDPGPLHRISDVILGSGPARVYEPTPRSRGTFVYFHGGGFVIGPEGYELPLRQLALATGRAIVAPHYRLAPESPFPAALEDALAAVWALGPGVGVVGDSSGGNLAARLTQALTREGRPPAFQVLIYPMLDATAGSPSYEEFADGDGFTRAKSLWYFDQYLPDHVDRRSPAVSPFFEDDVSGLPPTLIVTAERDPLRDEGELYAAKLERSGVRVQAWRYQGVGHGFFQMTGVLDEASRAHADIADWIGHTA